MTALHVLSEMVGYVASNGSTTKKKYKVPVQQPEDDTPFGISTRTQHDDTRMPRKELEHEAQKNYV
jgi:hypothetical protein